MTQRAAFANNECTHPCVSLSRWQWHLHHRIPRVRIKWCCWLAFRIREFLTLCTKKQVYHFSPQPAAAHCSPSPYQQHYTGRADKSNQLHMCLSVWCFLYARSTLARCAYMYIWCVWVVGAILICCPARFWRILCPKSWFLEPTERFSARTEEEVLMAARPLCGKFQRVRKVSKWMAVGLSGFGRSAG